MSVLPLDPAKLPAAGQALFATLSAKRKARGANFGGPYVALLNHPELARRIEELGFFLKFEGVLPRDVYQFIVLTVARATGAAFEWHDHVQHALAAGLSQELVDGIAAGESETLPQPYGLITRDLGEDDDVAGRAGRSAGAGRRAVGRGRTGRDRGALWILSDVRGHQPRLFYQSLKP